MGANFDCRVTDGEPHFQTKISQGYTPVKCTSRVLDLLPLGTEELLGEGYRQKAARLRLSNCERRLRVKIAALSNCFSRAKAPSASGSSRESWFTSETDLEKPLRSQLEMKPSRPSEEYLFERL